MENIKFTNRQLRIIEKYLHKIADKGKYEKIIVNRKLSSARDEVIVKLTPGLESKHSEKVITNHDLEDMPSGTSLFGDMIWLKRSEIETFIYSAYFGHGIPIATKDSKFIVAYTAQRGQFINKKIITNSENDSIPKNAVLIKLDYTGEVKLRDSVSRHHDRYTHYAVLDRKYLEELGPEKLFVKVKSLVENVYIKSFEQKDISKAIETMWEQFIILHRTKKCSKQLKVWLEKLTSLSF